MASSPPTKEAVESLFRLLCRSSNTIYQKVLEGGDFAVGGEGGASRSGSAVMSTYSAKPSSSKTIKYLNDMLAKSQHNAGGGESVRGTK